MSFVISNINRYIHVAFSDKRDLKCQILGFKLNLDCGILKYVE